jgi:hypothetical protein
MLLHVRLYLVAQYRAREYADEVQLTSEQTNIIVRKLLIDRCTYT